MSLLSSSQIAQIRGAIKSVTDTFAKTPITIHHVVLIDDFYQEDRNSIYAEEYSVEAFVEYKEEDKKESLEGSVDYNECSLLLNNDDMIELGLVVETDEEGIYLPVIETEKDYFTLKGNLYQITQIYFDGALEPKEVLLMVKGKKSQTRLNFLEIVS